MTTALLVATLAVQAKSITFTHPCASAAVVLEALGQELGEKIVPGGSVSKDFIALRFNARPPDEVKRVLAETLNAIWVRRGDFLVLDRGPAQENKEEDVETAALRAGIAIYLQRNPVREFSLEETKKLMIEVGRDPTSNDLQSTVRRHLLDSLPQALFGPRIVHAVGADALAELRAGESVSYRLEADGSTTMPPAVRRVVEQFRDEADAVFEAGHVLGAEPYVSFYGAPAPAPTGYTLRVNRDEVGIRIKIERDPIPNGRLHSQRTSSVQFSRGPFPAPPGEPFTFERTDGKLALSPEAMSLAVVIGGNSLFLRVANRATEQDMATAKRLGLDLVKNEPLAVYGGVPLDAVAAMNGRDYVALLPDHVAFDGRWLDTLPTDDLATVWKTWPQTLVFREDAKTKIVKIVPRDVRYTRARRIDRAATSGYLAELDRNGCVTLDALADFAASATEMQGFYTQLYVANAISGSSLTQIGSWEALKAFGHLSPSQRAAARGEGFQLDWATLPSELQNVLAPVALRQGRVVTSKPPDYTDIWSPGASRYATGSIEVSTPYMKTVPRGTTIRFRVLTGTLLKPGPPREGGSTGELFTVDDFAMRASRQPDQYSSDFTRATIANAERLHVDIGVPGIGYIHMTAQVDSATGNPSFLPLEKLPEPWKRELADAIKRIGGGL